MKKEKARLVKFVCKSIFDKNNNFIVSPASFFNKRINRFIQLKNKRKIVPVILMHRNQQLHDWVTKEIISGQWNESLRDETQNVERFGHSACFYESKMYIYGGRSIRFLSSFMCYDFGL